VSHTPDVQALIDRATAGIVLPSRRTSWTAADLLAAEFPAPRFAVQELIPEGLTFMAGAPKLGKSWLALALGIACSSEGGRALGKIPVEAGAVLYLALEDSPRRLQSRLRTLLGDSPAPSRLQIETTWSRLDDGGAVEIDKWLVEHPDARLVIVDVWPRIRPRPAKGTDYFTLDYQAAEPLQALATDRGVAILVLYHTRKAEAEDFVEMVQGTFGTAAAADTIVVIKRSRGKADATLYVTGRDVSEQELALQFAPEAGTWTLLGNAADYTMGETRAELLAAVKAHGSLSPKQAAELTSIRYDLVRQTLVRMQHDGQLAASNGRYSAPKTPVTPVTESPEEAPSSDAVTTVTGVEVADSALFEEEALS
jgi:hypothetical protein